MSEPYFGDCSISSLASNDDGNRSELGSIQTVELYQRLQDLEDMTANYLTIRPSALSAEHDSYTDIEPGDRKEFEYKLGTFSRGDVLALSVNCLPNCMVDDAENLIDENARSQIDHHPLEAVLRVIKSGGRSFDKEIVFKPSIHNGEFCFVMTVAHGVTPGSTLLLSVKNLTSEIERPAHGSLLQAIRVSLRIHSAVRSVPLENGRPVTGRTLSGEFAYYRFVCQDPEKLVSIRVKPLSDENGPIGDPDLYVTNKYEGLVAVTKDNCVWRSVNVGADRIDIHPHDPNAARGGAYMIGVMGYKDLNEFEIIAVMTHPEPINMIFPRRHFDFSVYAGQYSYFALRIDPRSRGKLLVKISDGCSAIIASDDVPSHHHRVDGGGHPGHENENENENVNAGEIYKAAILRNPQKYGHCVYVGDELSSCGIMPSIIGNEPRNPSQASHSEDGVSSLLTAAALGPSGLVIQDTVDSAAAAARMLSLHSASEISHISNSPSVFRHKSQVLSSAVDYDGDNNYPRSQHKISLPMSYCLKSGIFPVVYASTSTMYPSAHDYMWRGSGLDGTITMILESDEWKYSSGVCYFSVFGLDQAIIDPQNYSLPTATQHSESEKENSQSANSLNHVLNPALVAEMKRTGLSCKMSVQLYDEADGLDDGERARYKLFRYIYSDVDGASTSLRDRMSLFPDDKENSLTYGEVEYLSFQQLLRNVVASDGHIFYDLGSGTGKALLAAALSGIKFIRCVGIELLPELCACANKAIDELHKCLSGAYDEEEDPSLHVKFNSGYRGNGKGRSGGGNDTGHDDDNDALSQSMDLTIPAEEVGYLRDAVQRAKWSRVAAVSLRAGLPLLEVREGDFLSEDWSDADVVFVSSICFSDEILASIVTLGRCLRPGAKLLTLKLPPRESVFESGGGLFGNNSFAGAASYWPERENENSNDYNYNYDAGGGYDGTGGGGGGGGNWEKYFELECTAWCKTTWGRMKVFVLNRKEEFTSSGQQVFIRPRAYSASGQASVHSGRDSQNQSRSRGFSRSTGFGLSPSAATGLGSVGLGTRDRAHSGEWDNSSIGTRSLGSQQSRGGGDVGSVGGAANASSFAIPRPPSNTNIHNNATDSYSHPYQYSSATGAESGGVGSCAGGNAGDGIAALLDANKQLSYYEQGAKYLEELLAQTDSVGKGNTEQ